MNRSYLEKMSGLFVEFRPATGTYSLAGTVIKSNKKDERKAYKHLHEQFWDQRRKDVMTRDNWSCVNCGSMRNLDVHHIKQRSLGGTHSMDNLETLCRTCHERKHK